jgi:S1-C subfamily serine protease
VAAAAVAVLAVTASACADDGPAVAPTVVAVEAQGCRQPNRFHGVGIAVDRDLVVTAGHLVEGGLRELTVDGRPATVAALDLASDLALLTTRLPASAAPAELAVAVPATAMLVTPEGATSATIDRHVTLVVDHATDGATYRRDVVVFPPAVPAGTSGAPLLDGSGRLVAIVVATIGDETFAVTSREVAGLLAAPGLPPQDTGCASY